MKHIKIFEEWNQSKIDNILDKMNRGETLTDIEKRYLETQDEPQTEEPKEEELPSEPPINFEDDIVTIFCKIPKLEKYGISFDFHFKDSPVSDDKNSLLYGDLTILGVIYYGWLQVDEIGRYISYNFADFSSTEEEDYNEDDYIDFETMIQKDKNLSNYFDLFMVQVANELK